MEIDRPIQADYLPIGREGDGMTLSKPKVKQPVPSLRKRGGDLVPDETSASYAFIERAARDGRRVSTHGLTDDEVRALFLGDRKGE